MKFRQPRLLSRSARFKIYPRRCGICNSDERASGRREFAIRSVGGEPPSWPRRPKRTFGQACSAARINTLQVSSPVVLHQKATRPYPIVYRERWDRFPWRDTTSFDVPCSVFVERSSGCDRFIYTFLSPHEIAIAGFK